MTQYSNEKHSKQVDQQNFAQVSLEKRQKVRGHPGLNRGPLDLQSNALPLSYTPRAGYKCFSFSAASGLIQWFSLNRVRI